MSFQKLILECKLVANIAWIPEQPPCIIVKKSSYIHIEDYVLTKDLKISLSSSWPKGKRQAKLKKWRVLVFHKQKCIFTWNFKELQNSTQMWFQSFTNTYLHPLFSRDQRVYPDPKLWKSGELYFWKKWMKILTLLYFSPQWSKFRALCLS